MQVSIEATGNLGRRMTIAVPAERFEQEFSNRLKRLSKNLELPGFRPGKVPMKMVEAQYGGKLLEEVVGELIQSTFYEAVDKQGLKPAGGPKIEPKSITRGKDVEYTAIFEVYPEIKHLDIVGAAIERPVCSVTPEDVDRTLETMRRQRVAWKEGARTAKDGDKLSIDFTGSVDGKEFEGGKGQNFPIVLGSNSLIEGFETGLIGAAAGDERVLNLKFPEDYRNSMLAGRTVKFEIKVRQVSEPVLPALDAAFAGQLGIEDGNIETLRAEVLANLQREMDERIRTRLREQVFKALIEANPPELPQQLVEAEAARLLRLHRAELEARRAPADRIPNDPDIYKDKARRRVALGLILSEIVKEKGIIAPPEQVRARIAQMATTYESPQEFINWYYSQPERLAEVESLILEEEVVNRLLQSAQFKDKPMSFQDLMQTA